ncbi:hypothetical protein OC842_007009 [Tilletia horrida]|uniref:DUF4100 domain-containing protein n=1 Tax=Tilletia horrida TaxID=155126 RepID=A0AAN6G7H8_9BASI|nr:hypothetical protein OC842_007009 [Tilletia horrida]
MGNVPEGYLLLKIVTEDGKTWYSVHQQDAPLDETTSYINLSNGGKLRYLLDGGRLQPHYSPRYMGIEHGDIIEAFAEQFGGGDPGGSQLPGLLDAEDEEERYSETRFNADEEAHPTILAETRPAATFTKFGRHEHEGEHLPTSIVGTSGVTRTSPSPPAARDKGKLHPSELAGFQELLRPYHPPGRGQRDLTKLLPPVDPKTGNVQKWAGRGSRQFIRRYEQLGRVCEATPEDLIEMLSLNVLDESPDIYSLITSSPEFETRNWEDIKWFILTSFDGPPGEKYTAVDLEAFIKKDRTISTVAEIINYTLQYKEIADTLLRHNLITSALHVRYYVQGLPKTVRQELRHVRLDAVNPSFGQVEAAVRTHFMPSDFFARVTQDIDRTEAQRNNSALIKGPSVRISGSSRPTSSEQVIAQSIERFGTRVERVMQAMETGFKSLAAAPPAPGFVPSHPAGRAGPPATSPATGPNSVPLGGAPPARPDTCAYCNDSNHYKNKCPLLNEQMALGNVILHEGRVCWQDSSIVPGKWGAIHAVVQEHLRNGTIPRQGSSQPVQSNILMLSTMTHELHPGGGTYENGVPVGFEAFPAQRQNVGGDRNLRSRPYQPPAPPAQGAVPAGNPPGSVAPGIHAPQPPPEAAVQPAPPPNNTAQGTTSNASPAAPGAQPDLDEAMDADWQDKPTDPPAVRKLKAAFRSRASHLDRHADPDTMAETIMDLEISVTVRQILSLSKPVQKIFLNWLRGELLPIPIIGKGPWKSKDEWRRDDEEAAKQDGTTEVQVALSLIEALNRRQSPSHVADRIQHQLNNVSLRATPSDPWYSRSLPSTTVTIGRYAILALIDCGSQVNIMREDLLEALMLPLRTDRPQVIIGAAEQESSCAGLSECVATTLAGHTKPLHYFVQSACSYPIILGMSALAEFGIVLDCATGNITMTTPDVKQIKIKVVDLDDAANRQVMTTTLRPQVHHQALKLVEGGAWTDRPTPHHVNAKQKAVKDKANPSDQPPSSFFKEVVLGPVPFDRDPYETPLTPHPPVFQLNDYWTQERVDGLDLGPVGFINAQERDLLMTALDLHKSCLAWDITDLKILRPEISTGFHVNVVPHKIFQDQTYP